jgi:hypothetical protein
MEKKMMLQNRRLGSDVTEISDLSWKSAVVAGGKVLAVPLLALFLVPFLIQAAQAFQLNRVDYRPAVTQPVNRFPLGGINKSNTFPINRSNCAPTVNRFPLGGINTFSTNRSNYAPTVNHSANPGLTQMNNKMYGTGNKSMNITALRGNQTFKQNIGVPNRSNYAPTVTRSVNPGLTQLNNKMYGIGNKSMNITALSGNQTFKHDIGVPRNNATNLNPNLTRTTGVNVNNSRLFNTKLDFGARGKKF